MLANESAQTIKEFVTTTFIDTQTLIWIVIVRFDHRFIDDHKRIWFYYNDSELHVQNDQVCIVQRAAQRTNSSEHIYLSNFQRL